MRENSMLQMPVCHYIHTLVVFFCVWDVITQESLPSSKFQNSYNLNISHLDIPKHAREPRGSW